MKSTHWHPPTCRCSMKLISLSKVQCQAAEEVVVIAISDLLVQGKLIQQLWSLMWMLCCCLCSQKLLLSSWPCPTQLTVLSPALLLSLFLLCFTRLCACTCPSSSSVLSTVILTCTCHFQLPIFGAYLLEKVLISTTEPITIVKTKSNTSINCTPKVIIEIFYEKQEEEEISGIKLRVQ